MSACADITPNESRLFRAFSATAQDFYPKYAFSNFSVFLAPSLCDRSYP